VFPHSCIPVRTTKSPGLPVKLDVIIFMSLFLSGDLIEPIMADDNDGERENGERITQLVNSLEENRISSSPDVVGGNDGGKREQSAKVNNTLL